MKQLMLICLCCFINTAFSEVNEHKQVANTPYIECNFQSSEFVTEPITEDDFTFQSTLKNIIHDELVAQNSSLSEFLENDKKLFDPYYVEQAVEFFSNSIGPAINCFRDNYQDGDVIYKFERKLPYSYIEGFAVVNGDIKAILYTVIVIV